jgi:hypothetical protein
MMYFLCAHIFSALLVVSAVWLVLNFPKRVKP